jgi:hypothetical protein
MSDTGEGAGLGSMIEDVLMKGADVYAKILGARQAGEVAQIQYSSQVAIEQTRTKQFLYLGVGLLLAAFAIRMYKQSRG